MGPDSDAAVQIVGILVVLLLGWLHYRISGIGKKQDAIESNQSDRMRELYSHLDRTYQRRDMAMAEKNTADVRIDNTNARIDQLYAMRGQNGEQNP